MPKRFQVSLVNDADAADAHTAAVDFFQAHGIVPTPHGTTVRIKEYGKAGTTYVTVYAEELGPVENVHHTDEEA